MASTTISSPTPMTPAQLAAMDVSQRRAYFNSLPANQQSSQMQAWNAYRSQMNRHYMRTTIRKYAVCPPQSGNALTQNYALGTTLTYNVPTSENAFLEGLLFRVSVNLTFAAGTGATYALNPVGALGLIQEVDLLYGNLQMRFRPYILKYLPLLMNYIGTPEPGLSPITGATTNATIQSYLNSGFAVTGSTTWTFEFQVPFNLLHAEDVRGMLPIMSGETTAQVNVITASGLMGNDPILFPTYALAGTGNAVTLQATPGTVQVIAYYRDGISLLGPTRQGLDISGLPTIQWDIDPPLNNLQSGQVFRQKINKAENIAIALLTLVDGQTLGKFSSYTNIAELELSKDSSGTNKFWQYGLGTNISVNEFFADNIRRVIGQDLPDEGIIPVVVAPSNYTTQDARARNGVMYMNTMPSGWTDINYGVQVSATGAVSTVNPRVECHLIFINPTGLIAG